MPKKGKGRVNVKGQISRGGNQSVIFAQGQRRVSTPRGRNTTLGLAPRRTQSLEDRLSIYANQTAGQIANAQFRDAMDSFYERRAEQEQVREQGSIYERQLKASQELAKKQEAEARRTRARQTISNLRRTQSQEKALQQQRQTARMDRARARADANKQRREQRVIAQRQLEQQQQIARQQQQAQAQAQQQAQQTTIQLARQQSIQQEQIAERKLQQRERIAQQQVALQREGMRRQDRLMTDHLNFMRGMFQEAQAGQERRIGELEGKMNEGIRLLQRQRGESNVPITFLRSSSQGSNLTSPIPEDQLEIEDKVIPPPAGEVRRLERQISSQSGRPQPLLRQLSMTSQDSLASARDSLRSVLQGEASPSTIQGLGLQRQASNNTIEQGISRLKSIASQKQPAQHHIEPEPEQLQVSPQSSQASSPDTLRLEDFSGASTPSTLVDTSEEEDIQAPRPDTPPRGRVFVPDATDIRVAEQVGYDRGVEEAMGGRPATGGGQFSQYIDQFRTLEERNAYLRGVGRGKRDAKKQPEPEPEVLQPEPERDVDSLERQRLRRERREANRQPETQGLGGAIAEGVSTAGGIIGEGITQGAKAIGGAGLGVAQGLGEAVVEQLPSAQSVGLTLGRGAITGAGALGRGIASGIAQAGKGVVEALAPTSSEEEADVGQQPLIQQAGAFDYDVLKSLPIRRITTGSTATGWSPTQYSIVDNSGKIGQKGRGYGRTGQRLMLVEVSKNNYTFVNPKNDKLNNWVNVGKAKFDKLVKDGKIKFL